MSLIPSQYLTAVKVAGVVVVVAALWWVNEHYVVSPAVAAANAAWQKKWDDRDAADLLAKQQFTDEQRSIELSRQAQIDAIQEKANEDAQKARANAAAARRSADQLQSGIKDAIAKLQQSSSSDTAVTTGSASRTSAGLLLAELFRSINDRATDLAEEADRRGRAGLACEAAYNAVRNTKPETTK